MWRLRSLFHSLSSLVTCKFRHGGCDRSSVAIQRQARTGQWSQRKYQALLWIHIGCLGGATKTRREGGVCGWWRAKLTSSVHVPHVAVRPVKDRDQMLSVPRQNLCSEIASARQPSSRHAQKAPPQPKALHWFRQVAAINGDLPYIILSLL